MHVYTEHPFIIFIPASQRNPEELRMIGIVDTAQEFERGGLNGAHDAFRAKSVVVSVVFRNAGHWVHLHQIALFSRNGNAGAAAGLNPFSPNQRFRFTVAQYFNCKG